MFRKKMEILAENEKLLFEKLDRESLGIFEQYVEAWAYVNSESNLDAFKNGFKLGTKLVFDIFDD